MFVDVSFNLPMDRVWTYSVPLELQEQIFIGVKVRASFLKQDNKLGVVVRIHNELPNFATKAIDKVLTDNILLPPYIFFIRDKIAEYYGCSYNEALHLFVLEAKEPKRKVQQKSKIQFIDCKPRKFELNEEQKKVVDRIKKDSQDFSQFISGLIHGVTGSGKTEVYQTLIQQVIKKGKQALLLLPEIGLTTQIHQRFLQDFSYTELAFIHSKMSLTEKKYMFEEISNGTKKVIIGPRSALFSPFCSLGLIIMDEEHDFSYKSQQSPRYHTKRVAFILAQHLNIPFIMGSATPSIETYFAAQQKKIYLYRLTYRYHKTPLPTVQIVDMNQEKNFLSPLLMQKIAQVYKKHKQSILFINRRGFSPVIYCLSCGYIFRCPSCSITLTYHKQRGILLCHYCGFEQRVSNICPECHNATLKPKGLGTQRIEEELQELLHSYKILRMDKDTTSKKEAYEQIITDFQEGKADILIGTQMVTKGLDFPLVELVGILFCDMLLNLPDFRGSEHTFTLITQVAGRAGRKTQGEVILQTRFSEHYAIKSALKQDYEEFFSKEITLRKEYDYPPFSKFIRILVRSTSSQKAQTVIQKLAQQVQSMFPNLFILGPSICLIEKINNQFRYHFLLKVKDPIPFIAKIKPLIKEWNNKGDYHIECDVDPITLL